MYVWDVCVFSSFVVLGRWYSRHSAGVVLARRAAFYAGLGVGLVLMAGPLAHAALYDFQWHMTQHIGLMMLVAPAVVLGAPVSLLQLHHARQVQQALRLPALRLLLNPRIGWVLFVATLFSTHFTPLADLANTNTAVHQLVLCAFLGVGLVYYYPVLSGNPQPEPTSHAIRIVSLLTMMVPETMTGFVLYASGHALHEVRAGVDAATALHQQQAAGAFMWTAAMAIDTCWIALAVRDWLADEERRVDA